MATRQPAVDKYLRDATPAPGKATPGAGKATGAAAGQAEDTWSPEDVSRLIVDAWRDGCSDIHIEARPRLGLTRVRVRKDGALRLYREVPIEHHPRLVNQIKHLCQMKADERRMPQDGKFAFPAPSGRAIELRVATIPTTGGHEDVVMRILPRDEPPRLEMLGFSENNLAALRTAIAKPRGLFLVCGPTGSGKTTTLHSLLHHLDTPGPKIWTAEDPVEITQDALSQVSINTAQDLTFAVALRAFLRADPDVVMVGEMRDHETARIAIEASLTGPLVLSTLHTHSAAESVTRLLDMGLEPFTFGDALLAILAQRLARKLCEHCKTSRPATDEEIRALIRHYGGPLENTGAWKRDKNAAYIALADDWKRRFGGPKGVLVLHEKRGCEHCDGTGHAGRVALHELLVINDEIRSAIQRKARAAEILALGLAAGMRTLMQDAIEKALSGITDMSQVRVVGGR